MDISVQLFAVTNSTAINVFVYASMYTRTRVFKGVNASINLHSHLYQNYRHSVLI